MIHVINKDITTVEQGVIIHGVNCQRAMGSGVALALLTAFPVVYQAYMSLKIEDMKLGKTQLVPIRPDLFVVNAFTQFYFGADGQRYANSIAIKDCIYQAAQFCDEQGLKYLYAPKIGCGLGGLDWEKEVKPHFEELATLFPNINIVICEFNPTGK